ncbi:hypothetical protein GCM10022280_27170 [Sphingomonas swuensis]|uniref:HTH luxR-type domain-containing protein n=1 Tax=Sphingomonas swuensis TaxID=977800 RepID=A0ABP7TDZ2_9SPHN
MTDDLADRDLPAAALSERQKLCLRLVGRGMTSKEIALETGLTPQTVDTYIKGAMARLSASNRRDAARILADVEISQQMGSPPPAVVSRSAFVDQRGAAERRVAALLAPPPIGGRPIQLTGVQRTRAILRVALTAAVVVFALLLLITGVLMTFR